MLSRAIFALSAGTLLAYAGASLSASNANPVAREYGDAVAVGNGQARAYVTLDSTRKPAELGIALDESALEGLPTAGSGHAGDHAMPHTFLLDLPASVAPFRFVELN